MSNPTNNEQTHWLVRESTIKKLWIGLYISLLISVLAESFMTPHPQFGANSVDGSFGFSAWFGFICCVLMVIFAKLLGLLIKRPDNYYRQGDHNNE